MAALRDAFRSSVVGLLIRSVVVLRYRRYRRLAQAKQAAKTDPAKFECPICSYRGMFVDRFANGENKANRRYAICPNCGAAERHRLQSLVLDEMIPSFGTERKETLHFAPEPSVTARLERIPGRYRTADRFRRDVDLQVDISDLPLESGSVDFVYASHVLEHVPDDVKAVRELYRILRPGGIAVLPVPIYSTDGRSRGQTEEYGHARADEDGHVRAPGLDYFERYREVFDEIKIYTSNDFSSSPDRQLFILAPDKDGSNMDRLPDYVPVCFKR